MSDLFAGVQFIQTPKKKRASSSSRRARKTPSRKVTLTILPSIATRLKSRASYGPDSVRKITNCVKHIEGACSAAGFYDPETWAFKGSSINKNLVRILFDKGSLKVRYNFLTGDYEVSAYIFDTKVTSILKPIKTAKKSYEKIDTNFDPAAIISATPIADSYDSATGDKG